MTGRKSTLVLTLGLVLASGSLAGAEPERVYDDNGLVPGGPETDLFLEDPMLDPAWLLPEPGAFDDAVPVDDLEPPRWDRDEEAPVAIAPLPLAVQPGFERSPLGDQPGAPAGSGSESGVVPSPAEGELPKKLIGGDPVLTRALEAARRVAPPTPMVRRPGLPPTIEEQAAGSVPVEELPSPLDEQPEPGSDLDIYEDW